jgi:hypothetical protein
MRIDTSQVFRMVCYPYDPNSCAIAARYRDVFVNYWTPSSESTFFDANNPAPIRGFQIITQSEHHPIGALDLRQRLSKQGPVGFYVAPSLVKDPNEFWIVVGPQP